MNIDRVRELADFIEEAPEDLPGGIGAYAAALWPDVRVTLRTKGGSWAKVKLMAKLGITQTAHDGICFPRRWADGKVLDVARMTRAEAAGMLRRLAAGEGVKFVRGEGAS